MTPARWLQVKTILEGALERPPDERSTFVAGRCGLDQDLRREVESLLASDDEIGDWIEKPLFTLDAGGPEAVPEGEVVGAYRIRREIGRGGMGSVYLAERADAEFERTVAVKVIRRGMDSDEIVRRFRGERQILAHLTHPNIAGLLDGGTTADGRPYFVMEHVEGLPIDEYCDARRLSVRERLELFRTVCGAVHFAHQNLVVHRDLKPCNILVTADGTPKLLDFGIAKLLGPDAGEGAFTRLGLRPMTPEYASPEQVAGGPITTASDVYSLGVLLFRLLVGESPYGAAAGDPERLARAIRESDPAKPSSVIRRRPIASSRGASRERPEAGSDERPRWAERRALRRRLAGDLDNVVGMALRKDPARRYASAEQLAADVTRHLDGLPVIARADKVGYRAAKFVGRHKLGVAVAVGVLGLSVGYAVSYREQFQKAVREQERSQRVATFLEDLFESTNPSESRGENVTARELLDRGEKKIAEGLGEEPLLQADLMETMGRVYRNLGLYQEAERLLTGSLRIRRRELGSEHLQVADGLHNLAFLRRELDDVPGAEALLRQALEIQRRQGASRTQHYAKGLNDLAGVLEAQERYEAAESLYREALALKREILPPLHEDIARGLNNLGAVLYKRQRLDEAKTHLEAALAMRRRLLEDDHPDVLTTLGNLASAMEEQGDAAGAEKLYAEILQTRRRIYGPRHPIVASTLNNLAFALQAQGKHEAAEPLYLEALSIADESLGRRDHRNPATFLRNLADALLAQGKTAEAEAAARESVAAFRAATPGSSQVAAAESLLGACLAAQGRYEEAETLLLTSYGVLAADESSGAEKAADAKRRIVSLYTSWGKPERAAAFRESGQGTAATGQTVN